MQLTVQDVIFMKTETFDQMDIFIIIMKPHDSEDY